jgi:hypothetical protein
LINPIIEAFATAVFHSIAIIRIRAGLHIGLFHRGLGILGDSIRMEEKAGRFGEQSGAAKIA